MDYIYHTLLIVNLTISPLEYLEMVLVKFRESNHKSLQRDNIREFNEGEGGVGNGKARAVEIMEIHGCQFLIANIGDYK